MGPLALEWSGIVRVARPLVVPEGKALVLRPGTRVVLDAALREPALVIRGTLRAEGAFGRAGAIVFFPEGETPEAVRLEGKADAVLSWVRFFQGATGLRALGEARAALADCSFLEHSAMGVLAEERARVSLSRCALEGNATGATTLGEAALTLDACRVRASAECGLNAMGGSTVEARACQFEGSHTAVSVSDRARAELSENDFRANLVGAHAKDRAHLNLWRNRFHGGPSHDVDLVGEATISAIKEAAFA